METLGPDHLAARRASFLQVGPDYERTRPGYPVDAIGWITGPGPKRIADLGCGPGKLTAQLATLGHDAVGIDPSPTMLEGMRSRALPAVCATAERLPLRAASVDVVTAAQAFHWFDADRAVPEIRRVLRSGGHVGILWNLRDESADWVRDLSKIIGSEDAMASTLGEQDALDEETAAQLTTGGSFTDIESRTFPHEQTLDEEGLVGLVRSRSYVAILPIDERKRVLEAVRKLCREHPDLHGHDRFVLPYRTRTFRAIAA